MFALLRTMAGRLRLATFVVALLTFVALAPTAYAQKDEGKIITIKVKHEGTNDCKDVTIPIAGVKPEDIESVKGTATDGKRTVDLDKDRKRDERPGSQSTTIFLENSKGEVIKPGDSITITVKLKKSIEKKKIGIISIRVEGKDGKRHPDDEHRNPDVDIKKEEDGKKKGSITLDPDLVGVITLADVEWGIAPPGMDTELLLDTSIPLGIPTPIAFSQRDYYDPCTLLEIEIPDGFEGSCLYVRFRILKDGIDCGMMVWALDIDPDESDAPPPPLSDATRP